VVGVKIILMDSTAITDLIVYTVAGLGVAFLIVLTAIFVIALGMLVVRFGAKKIANVAGEGGSFIESEAEYPKAARDRIINAIEGKIKKQNPSFDY